MGDPPAVVTCALVGAACATDRWSYIARLMTQSVRRFLSGSGCEDLVEVRNEIFGIVTVCICAVM